MTRIITAFLFAFASLLLVACGDGGAKDSPPKPAKDAAKDAPKDSADAAKKAAASITEDNYEAALDSLAKEIEAPE